MSHSIIIIDENIECVKSNFPALEQSLDDLQTVAHVADSAITEINSAQNKRIHEQLEEVQAYVVERCSNMSAYKGQEQVMEAEIINLTDELEQLL